jgi:hypothetical protein
MTLFLRFSKNTLLLGIQPPDPEQMLGVLLHANSAEAIQ